MCVRDISTSVYVALPYFFLFPVSVLKFYWTRYCYQTQTCLCTYPISSKLMSETRILKQRKLYYQKGRTSEKALLPSAKLRDCFYTWEKDKGVLETLREGGPWNKLEVSIPTVRRYLGPSCIRYVRTNVTAWFPLGFYKQWINGEEGLKKQS